jgi:molybdopterin converting factor small subunit
MNQVTILIPPPMQRHTGNRATIEVDASTVKEAMDTLDARYPGVGGRMFDAQGRLRHFLNVYVGSDDIRHLSGLDSAVRSGDEITILSAFAGG